MILELNRMLHCTHTTEIASGCSFFRSSRTMSTTWKNTNFQTKSKLQFHTALQNANVQLLTCTFHQTAWLRCSNQKRICNQLRNLTAAFPHPRGPRRRTELLQASETELETRYFSLLSSTKGGGLAKLFLASHAGGTGIYLAHL